MSYYKLTIKPSGEVLEIKEGEKVLDLLRAKDIYIKSSCGGHATCSDCIVKILAGEDNLSPSPFPELKLLGNVFHITKERLACQLTAMGDITIDIGRHDKEKDETKTSSKKNNMKNNMKKTAPIKVRKEQEVRDIKEDRFQSREEKNKKMEDWQKHWEKDPSGKPKNLGGNKRPRYFDTDKIDYDKKDFSRPLPEHKKEKLEKSESSNEKSESEKSDKEFSNFRDKK